MQRPHGILGLFENRRSSSTIPQPTTVPSSHPVRRRPTRRGAGVVQGVKVERATVQTNLTRWAATARLCLGRRQTGWELPAHATLGRRMRTAPPPSRSLSAPAGGMLWPLPRSCGARLMPTALCTCASAQRGPSGPEARAAPAAEPGLDESRESSTAPTSRRFSRASRSTHP